MPARKKSARKISPKKTTRKSVRASSKRKAATRKPAVKATEQVTGSDHVLDNILTINSLGELQQSLAALVDDEGDLELDVSNIEMIDTAALQLMLAFVYRRRVHQRRTSWLNPSDAFISNAEVLGLSAALDIHGSQ